MKSERLLDAEEYAEQWLAKLRERHSRPINRRAARHWGRARKHGGKVDEAITDEDLSRAFSVYGDRCVYCGAAGYLEIDHFVPLALGGAHETSNFVPACIDCNRNKGHLSPWAFVSRLDASRVHPDVIARLA